MLKVGATDAAFFYAFKEFFPQIELIKNPAEAGTFDLVIFPGGEDISPSLYGQKNTHCYGVNEERDTMEQNIFFAIQESVKTSILGVCRGHQLINVLQGGTLMQDMRQEFNISHSSSHPLSWNTQTKWAECLPKYVNSLHHQAIRYIGNSLTSLADVYAASGQIVEMCQSNPSKISTNIITVQFHPEFMKHQPFFDMVNVWAEKWKEDHVSSTNNKRRRN
jgi:putative glutamine amidotransferase